MRKRRLRRRTPGSVVKGRCQTLRRSARRVNGATGPALPPVTNTSRPSWISFDTHHLRWCHCGHLGSVAEQLGKVAEPEHLAGPGVVAQLQFEVGERALRLRPGDAAAEGPSSKLPPSPAVECGDQTDGGKAKEAGTHGNRSNIAPRRVRNGWTNLGSGIRPVAVVGMCATGMVEGQRQPRWNGASGHRGFRLVMGRRPSTGRSLARRSLASGSSRSLRYGADTD